MKYIKRIFISIFRWIPFSASITLFDYLQSAFVPSVITYISVNLFDSAEQVLNGNPVRNRLCLFAFLYLIIYLVNDFSSYFRSIVLNAGVYEKGTAYFRIALYEKMEIGRAHV